MGHHKLKGEKVAKKREKCGKHIAYGKIRFFTPLFHVFTPLFHFSFFPKSTIFSQMQLQCDAEPPGLSKHELIFSDGHALWLVTVTGGEAASP